MASNLLFLAAGLFSVSASAGAPLSLPIIPRQSSSLNASLPRFPNFKASADLKWTDCYDTNFQCAYLTVPLDYANATAGTTDLAFIRYLVSEQAEDLISNPGGPGESGIDYVLGYGPGVAKRWGYNLVSFDPRAVANTKLRVSCGENNTPSARDSGDDYIKQQWDENYKDRTACSKFNKNTNAKYVGTSAGIQDLVHFTEVQAKLRGKDPKKTLINYYGVSYGTLFGQTLVAMYPDRLRRVHLDANEYGVGYYQGWEPTSVSDIPYAIQLFTKSCYQAGPHWCELAYNASSSTEVQGRFDEVIAKISKGNIVKEDGSSLNVPDFLSNTVQMSVYFPQSEAQGSFGNYTTLANLTMGIWLGDYDAPKMSKRDYTSDDEQVALDMITTVDVADRYPWKTFKEFKAARDRLQATFPYDADMYAGEAFSGLANTIIPPPSQYFPGFKAIKPSCPVLFANTNGDPVCPHVGAQAMSKLFAGSAVVIVDGPGHSTSQAPSKCVNAIVDAYMINGTVPAQQETWCKAEVSPSYYFGDAVPQWVQDSSLLT